MASCFAPATKRLMEGGSLVVLVKTWLSAFSASSRASSDSMSTEVPLGPAMAWVPLEPPTVACAGGDPCRLVGCPRGVSV